MLYRPHFCCHCGEKIVRAKWTPLTSRRFCEFCAIEQKQHDLIPRAAAVTIVLFGAAGLTAYFGGGQGSSKSEAGAPAMFRPLKQTIESTDHAGKLEGEKGSRSSSDSNNAVSVTTPRAEAGNSKQRAPQGNSSTEAVYYCGAMTKKGTACTRRVKVPGRCWQHLGQPAMRSSPN